MKIGLGIGIPFIRNYISSLFDPSKLFTGSTNGVWYDPSDYSTLYQNAAGTTPVTAVEQPVGLMLDKSKGGVGTNGAKRVNLLSYTEQFDNGYWAKTELTVGLNEASPFGGLTALKLTPTTTSSIAHRFYKNTTLISGNTIYSIYVKPNGYTQVALRESMSTGSAAVFTLTGAGSVAGTYNAGSVTVSNPTISSIGNGWYRISAAFSGNSQTFGFYVLDGTWTSGTVEYAWAGDGVKSVIAWGADLRLASEASTLPTYQKITDTWYNTIPGNHAFNSSGNSANFPVLSARYNLLTKSEQFDDAVWAKNNATVTNPTATTIVETTAANSEHNIFTPIDSAAAATYTFSVECALSSGTRYAAIQIAPNNADNSTGRYTVVVDLSDGSVKSEASGAGTTGKSKSVTSTGSGKWRISVSAAHSSGTVYGVIGMSNSATPTYNASSNPTYTGDGTSGIYIWGADLRVANDALNQPAYQRVNTSTDYDTNGFKPYLRFNGTNQWLQTNSIDFTYGDKMFVSAGVRKLSDAAIGMLIETSAVANSNDGAFAVAAPGWSPVAGQYGSLIRASVDLVYANSPASFAAPITSVLSESVDFAGSTNAQKMRLRVNGADQSLSFFNATSTGNFGNYPLYIGARAGSSLWFNGRLYGMVVAGKQASAAEIENTENYLEVKTFGKDMQYVYSDPLLTAASEQITTAGGEDIYLTVTYQ